jgi:Fe2+ or Zn2+ uptake regulation protein
MRRLEGLKAACRDRSSRLTQQRIEIFREVAAAVGKSGVPEVLDEVSKKKRR